jgi:putative transposase
MLELVNIVDKIYTDYPFFGTRRMSAYLYDGGYKVGRKLIKRIYQILGLEAVYPKPNLSKPNQENKIYPYLLRDIEVTHSDQIWSTDITYIRLNGGFVYLVAIIDWFSRYVLDWDLDISLEAEFCIETLKRALQNNRCEIFNTDQGSQFTCKDFTDVLLQKHIQISMDGKGRALDNVFVERLWRSLKYECIYMRSMNTVKEARKEIKRYFYFYNNERPHQSLQYKKPVEIYRGKK